MLSHEHVDVGGPVPPFVALAESACTVSSGSLSFAKNWSTSAAEGTVRTVGPATSSAMKGFYRGATCRPALVDELPKTSANVAILC